MMATGDTARDLDTIRRYLVRLVPQLEMELSRAESDRFGEAYAQRVNGMAEAKKSGEAAGGAEALADHLLDRSNPHGVTLAQLGFNIDKIFSFRTGEHSMLLQLGGKQGIQLNWQTVRVTAGTGAWEAEASVWQQDVVLGDWEIPLDAMLGAWAQLMGSGLHTVWAGRLAGASKTSMGRVKLLTPREIPEEEEPDEEIPGSGTQTNDEQQPVSMTIDLTVFGMGVYGYGGE